jgi:hypothetical protein
VGTPVGIEPTSPFRILFKGSSLGKLFFHFGTTASYFSSHRSNTPVGVRIKNMEPMSGIEPPNLTLTKGALFQLSYMGANSVGRPLTGFGSGTWIRTKIDAFKGRYPTVG